MYRFIKKWEKIKIKNFRLSLETNFVFQMSISSSRIYRSLSDARAAISKRRKNCSRSSAWRKFLQYINRNGSFRTDSTTIGRHTGEYQQGIKSREATSHLHISILLNINIFYNVFLDGKIKKYLENFLFVFCINKYKSFSLRATDHFGR